ncbi:hypothetical protein V6N11_022647 [Hibiscus sabdariffa]|uniref:RNase H type-1 domain-containing protein n=1 Tax=Hibiscus sabdariffa TaxID=183260 RepID=A0ABR2TKA8_9ROSI
MALFGRVDFVNNPSSLLWLKVVSEKAFLAWSIPSETSLIFNVDGAAVGGFGRAGIGGVMRNSENKMFIMFSKFIGFFDASSAELLATRDALPLFSVFRWSNLKLVFEFDCKLCCDWLEKSSSAPDAFKYVIEDIIQYGAGLDWFIKVIPREENSTIDCLAKSEISRKVPFVWVCQD